MNVLADRALTRPAPLGHGLVDDHHQWCAGAIRLGEVSAIEQRNLHGLEVVTISRDEGSKA